MDISEFFKVLFLGIVEGITEWLPISSTGHMILVDEFLQLDVSVAFRDLFLVFIQLGAIMAVVVIYWEKLIPCSFKNGIHADNETLSMWFKILVASLPAGVVGILYDDMFTAWFYNYQTVAIMLILFGILFIIIENHNRGQTASVCTIADISYQSAFWIGVFQMIAAVFPGTSRSGATIAGALLIGISRTTAAEFTFFLAIPAMFGGSLIKLLKFGFTFTPSELMILLTGMLMAYLVSVLVIRLMMEYIKKHDFKVFGWYRIVLGFLVLIYFTQIA